MTTPDQKLYPCKTVLITNLSMVVLEPLMMRIEAHALAIRDDAMIGNPQHRRRHLTGFGTCCEALVFELHLQTTEYLFEPESTYVDQAITIDGHRLRLAPEDTNRPICFDTIEGGYIDGGAHDDNPWFRYNRHIGQTVIQRVSDYWRAPFMPGPIYNKPGIIRELLLARDGSR